MHFRSVLSGTLALLLLTSIAAPASGTEQPSKGGLSFHLPKINLPGVFGEKSSEKPDQVQFAQDGTSATALQEQLRQMNGRIEELNFQVLQMQEQIRKQQEDNEFRFQQLEGGSQGAQQPGEQKKSDATTETESSVAEAPATHAPADAGTPPDAGQEVIVESPTGEPGTVIQGAPPKTFGTITVDKNGNVVDSDGNTQAHAPANSTVPIPGDQATDGQATGTQTGNPDDTVVAALPATDDPEELYRNSYQFILSGDYNIAEQGFRDHIARYPRDAKAADAHYWLGESLLGQQKYRDAAETFLAASKDYPKAKKAPDMLLKLGVSLVGLNQRDVACATFGEIGKRYPNVSGALKERVKQERALAAC